MDKLFGKNTARILLQVAIAFAFLYAASSSFLRPNDWVGYLPSYLKFLDRYLLLKLFSSLEIVLALWLLSGWKLLYAAFLSALVLLGITVSNLGIFDVTFRDVSLVLSALALSALAQAKN